MANCPKCGGEMVDGTAYVSVTVPSGGGGGGFGGMMSPMPSPSMTSMDTQSEARLMWREKTGERKGFIIKSNVVRDLNVKGLRCVDCGYIELYAQNNKK
jgi:predicted nucleic-acid-binding Zn-ribbon protein